MIPRSIPVPIVALTGLSLALSYAATLGLILGTGPLSRGLRALIGVRSATSTHALRPSSLANVVAREHFAEQRNLRLRVGSQRRDQRRVVQRERQIDKMPILVHESIGIADVPSGFLA